MAAKRKKVLRQSTQWDPSEQLSRVPHRRRLRKIQSQAKRRIVVNNTKEVESIGAKPSSSASSAGNGQSRVRKNEKIPSGHYVHLRKVAQHSHRASRFDRLPKSYE